MLVASGCQVTAVGYCLSGVDFCESFFQVVFRVFPFEGLGDLVVQSLKSEYAGLQRFQVREVVGREDLALQHREEEFNLIEPACVYGGMDLNGVGIPLGKPADRGLPLMRGTIIRNPEDSPCRAIGLLLHDQIHKLVERFDSSFLYADPEELGPVDIPGRKISQGTFSFVFKLHTPWLMRPRPRTYELSVSGLNTGLFIRTDHVVIWSQRDSFKESEIEVQDTGGFFCEERVSWKKPAPMHPGSYCVPAEVAPDRGDADCDHNAPKHYLSGDVAGAEAGKRETQSAGEFTGHRFDFHNGLRGKNGAVYRTSVGPRDLPSLRGRNVFSIL